MTGQSYKVHTTATCKTKNLVYLIECRKCNKQYVGETENALHIRLNDHRSDVKTKKMEKPVAAHFNLPGHSMEELTIMVIEKIWREDVQLRRRRESYWIHHLRSVAPEGMNLEDWPADTATDAWRTPSSVLTCIKIYWASHNCLCSKWNKHATICMMLLDQLINLSRVYSNV